jgi:beta-galactosidase
MENHHIMADPKGVVFGVDYYPEQWERSLWESDAERMQQMGFREVRLMEFAWALLEPSEGHFDFSLFDEVIDILSRHNLKVILGTPTATIPAWLYQKDPGICQTHPGGLHRDFGARRYTCFNSPTYLAACERIVSAVAEHFGHSPNVVGWQLDNEVGHEGSDRCICPNCQKKWPQWLKAKYGSIDRLNAAWGAVFWGTTYASFDQAPVPGAAVASFQNPSLILDYDRFCSDAVVNFIHRQADVLRARVAPSQWLTTNLYPTPNSTVIDMEQLVSKLDKPCFDNYPVWGDQNEPLPYYMNALLFSYIRGLKETGTFSIFEQFCGFQGHTCLGYLPPEDQMALWTNQVVARGANEILYFRWRTARFAQEQLCYGLLDPDSQDTDRAQRLVDNMRQTAPIFEKFADVPVESPVCMVYDKDNARLLREQYLSKGLVFQPTPYMQVGYDVELARNSAPYILYNVNMDFKSTSTVELERYKLISLPLYEMADPVFVARLEQWVKQGGHLIVGWHSGARDRQNQAVTSLLPGLLAEMAGVYVRKFESLNTTKTGVRIGLFPTHGEVWADIVEPVTARVLARYSGGKKFYSGSPAITVNDYGQGKVYYVGTSLAPLGLLWLYRRILKDAGLKPQFLGMDVEAVRRRTTDGSEVEVILNHSSGRKLVKGHLIEPYGMRVLPCK